MSKQLFLFLLFFVGIAQSQNYFYEDYQPFNEKVPSPETYLGYAIGDHHTRHDLIVSYFEELAKSSDRATVKEYGRTHEGRKLVMLTVTSPKNFSDMENIKQRHLAFTNPSKSPDNYNEVPIFVNLAYNVHGNEPSSSEAALLVAYTLVASQNPEVLNYLDNAIIFIDPTINPDGRDRHTQWANTYQGHPEVADPQDAEHNEYWPGGRTNHYWFDLNRDWLLAVNPESRGKLKWFHEWYPNVVTDYHEMGTQSTYFFEPMKDNASLNPIMPKENYGYLNTLFGNAFSKALDEIGSLYFTREIFDGTYPGYGSSYPDLQGSLAILFEQASSRGHKQKTAFGEITFPFTIRNQYITSFTTLKTAVENKAYLRKYQQDFFKSALTNASDSKVRGYVFGDSHDKNRTKAFIDKLLIHKIKVYKDGNRYVVPTDQPQYRMVQTMFETYEKYRDSVYYDASAWSLTNFYNMKAEPMRKIDLGKQVISTKDIIDIKEVKKSDYAYIIDWNDYNAPAALYYLQDKGIVASSSAKPYTVDYEGEKRSFDYGAIVVPVSLQKQNSDEVFDIMKSAQEKFEVPIINVSTGLTSQGIDLGSRNIDPLKKPKAVMLIGEGVRSYDAGEVWHLLDTRVHMPITKIPIRNFKRADFDKYTTMVMVSGRYNFNEKQIQKIKDWIYKGNTLITLGTASKWAIDKKLVEEKLTTYPKDSTKVVKRKPYIDASQNIGKENIGGAIVKADLDLTHPLAYGYVDNQIPVYKNNTVWLKPSKNAYSTVVKYADDPHIDGFITEKNIKKFMKPSASLIVSKLGNGKVILFADNPNFRGSWYGTNRLFLNALFLGELIRIPD